MKCPLEQAKCRGELLLVSKRSSTTDLFNKDKKTTLLLPYDERGTQACVLSSIVGTVNIFPNTYVVSGVT